MQNESRQKEKKTRVFPLSRREASKQGVWRVVRHSTV